MILVQSCLHRWLPFPEPQGCQMIRILDLGSGHISFKLSPVIPVNLSKLVAPVFPRLGWLHFRASLIPVFCVSVILA